MFSAKDIPQGRTFSVMAVEETSTGNSLKFVSRNGLEYLKQMMAIRHCQCNPKESSFPVNPLMPLIEKM